MTKFEQFLLEKGYLKFILNCKTMKYEIAKNHTISTIVNLDHRYFHKTDANILQKISDGKTIIAGKEISYEDRKNEIIFGLSEAYKPPTLRWPRPNIKIKKKINNIEIIENQELDDNMNIVLQKISYDNILSAMYDNSICLEVDLT